jgi:hypothetical protein
MCLGAAAVRERLGYWRWIFSLETCVFSRHSQAVIESSRGGKMYMSVRFTEPWMLLAFLLRAPMRLRLLVSYFASCGGSFVAAQPNPNPKAGQPVESLPPIFAPRAAPKEAKAQGPPLPASSTPPPRRAISPEMSAKLSAIATRAAPPASATPSTSVAASAPVLDSSDVVQLKPYVVHEDRLPEFKERNILTPKGKLALARRRYPGLFGPLSDASALRMLEEDFTRERLQELTDLKGLLEIGGAKLSPELKRNIGEAAMRPSGFSPQIGEPFRQPK